MKFLKDDILLSRFLQFSLLGTMLLILVLLSTDQPVFTSAYDPAVQPLDTGLSDGQAADSLPKGTQPDWLNRSLEWLQHQIALPPGEW